MTISIPGVRVGHWSDPHGETGCTVLILPEGTVASCEVRGGAPASRELDVLAPDKTVPFIDAVVLTGGSAFGLAAADGVMRYLEEHDRGVSTPGGKVPIVPALALFDLSAGDPKARPTAERGYAAAHATTGEQVLTGRVGAGTGAYTGHWRGPGARRAGGLAYTERRWNDLVVGALCVVNAFGDIDDGAAEISLDPVTQLDLMISAAAAARMHTTIGTVITNAKLDKVGCHIVAQGAHDGLSRALTPPHGRFDGDGFIAAATGSVDADVDLVRLMALATVTDAIRSVATAPQ
ncbi:P1 family peptidase [Nocardia brasiliensis]|uniref:P1 family peptidase n=2 Tax=Nocardia brasiliensis TaxID=37326 RepID=UPI0018945DC5|nr:P1 family peptidase [Nocardia brasiliensis]MBF6129963.1 P1 family peptidase [Nocardia brasiliensis]MBF6542296.1 P1 family peptidase [Nocardia brasiliensis]